MPYIHDDGDRDYYMLDSFLPITVDSQFGLFEKQYAYYEEDANYAIPGYDFKIGLDQVLMQMYSKNGIPTDAFLYVFRTTMHVDDTFRQYKDQTSSSYINYNGYQSTRAGFAADDAYRTGPFNLSGSMGVGGYLNRGIVDNSSWFDNDSYDRGVFDRNDGYTGYKEFYSDYTLSDNISKFGDELKKDVYQYEFFLFKYSQLATATFTHDFGFRTISDKNLKSETKLSIVTSFNLI